MAAQSAGGEQTVWENGSPMERANEPLPLQPKRYITDGNSGANDSPMETQSDRRRSMPPLRIPTTSVRLDCCSEGFAP